MIKTPHEHRHSATRHWEHGLQQHKPSLKGTCLMYSGAVGMKSSMGIRFSELGNLGVSISIPLLDFSDEFYSDLTGIKKQILVDEICWDTVILSVPMPCWCSQQKNGERISQHQHYQEIPNRHFYKKLWGLGLVSPLLCSYYLPPISHFPTLSLIWQVLKIPD